MPKILTHFVANKPVIVGEMKKIAIIGSPGAGKSTLARKMEKILGINVIHLDRYYWQKDWKGWPKDQWEGFQELLVQHNEWIIDGTYISTVDIRLIPADTIIFLDTHRLRCLTRVIKRHFIRRYFRFAEQDHSDFSDECPDRLNFQYMKKVFVEFPRHDRSILLEKFEILEPTKHIIWLKSMQEVNQLEVDLRDMSGFDAPHLVSKGLESIPVSELQDNSQFDTSNQVPVSALITSGV